MNDNHSEKKGEQSAEATAEANAAHPRYGRCSTSRRARMLIGAVVLLGAGALGGALTVTAVAVSAHSPAAGEQGEGHGGGWHGRRHGGEFGERALDRLDRVLGRVDATPEQKEQVSAIGETLMQTLKPLREQHRENRRELFAELTRPSVDRAALEALRGDELALADTASSALVDALSEAAAVLTPEQRAELAEFATRHRRGRH